MQLNGTSRVHFFEKQFLRTQDFVDEQLYHLTLLRRHVLSEHSWGIISGLDLAIEEGLPLVRAGMAIDGYGRELILGQKQHLRVSTFDDLGSEKLDVWLLYGRSENTPPPDGYGACGSTGSRDAYRSDEIPQILLEKPLPGTIDPRRPRGVPQAVLTSPVPVTSDDPNDIWRVYLGRVTRGPQPDQFSVDLSQRPYAGLVGELIDHPANAARVEIGRVSNVDDSRQIGGTQYFYQKGEDRLKNESRRFAIFVPEPQDDEPQVQLSPRLEILQDGTLRARGKTVINGSLRLSGGAVQFLTAAPPPTADNAPQQPSIYRVKEVDQLHVDFGDQLRVDLGSDNTANRQFVIGFSSDDGKFVPCLKLELKDTNGSGKLSPLLTVYGDLKIEGKLDSPDPKALTLSQDAKNAILASFQAGVAAGGLGS